MPARAVKPELPPVELGDRSEGWGMLGLIRNYPSYKDSGTWPEIPEHNSEFPLEQPETSDGDWYRNGELIS